jgi:hypothetical protein
VLLPSFLYDPPNHQQQNKKIDKWDSLKLRKQSTVDRQPTAWEKISAKYQEEPVPSLHKRLYSTEHKHKPKLPKSFNLKVGE